MKRIILLIILSFATSTHAVEYCINEKIELRGTTHHVQISNGDDYSLEQLGKYTHVIKLNHPTNLDVEVVIDGYKKYVFVPQANCEDLPIEI
jgi:hypothetical protein